MKVFSLLSLLCATMVLDVVSFFFNPNLIYRSNLLKPVM